VMAGFSALRRQSGEFADSVTGLQNLAAVRGAGGRAGPSTGPSVTQKWGLPKPERAEGLLAAFAVEAGKAVDTFVLT
jgi:hypothetical protein